MSSVDQRVVQMQFDNAQFEAGVRQSQRTLQQFDRSLQNENGAQGMSKLAQSVDVVKERFSALGIAGATVIMNLTNSAINFAKRLVAEFTFAPIKQGLQEYELQMNSVQTMMANTGRSVKDVNDTLDDLNVYADKTIYNFAEMTSNMGRFTAAGVNLEDAKSSIKGIANLAALSGSNSQQASMAMYQLSQAIASGRVNLQDWNSVVNAGMGGTKFQEALRRTAEAQGVIIDRSKSFRESISGQDTWLTGDILLETLKQIGGEYDEAALRAQGFTDQQIAEILKMAKNAEDAATVVKTFTQLIDTLKEAIGSGWAQSFRTVIGDFEEAKELWTGVNRILSDIIDASSEARNAMLSAWKEMGGRDALIQAISNAWESLVAIMTPVKQAFEKVFPPMTAERLVAITNGLKAMTERFKEWATSSEVASRIHDTFSGLFSVIKMGVDIVRGLAKVFGTFVAPVLARLGDLLLSVASAIGRFFTGIQEGMPSGDAFQALLDGIKNTLGPVGDFLDAASKALIDFFSNLGKGSEEAGKVDFFGNFLDHLAVLKDKIVSFLGPIAAAIKQLFKPITDAISKMTSNLSLVDWTKVFATGGLAGVMALIAKFVHDFDKIFGSVDDFIESLKETFTGGDSIVEKFKGVFDVLQSYQNNLNAQAIRTIAISVGILAASMFVIASIDSDKLLGSVAAMGALFTILVGAVAALQAISKKMNASGSGLAATSASLVAMSVSIAILAGALKAIASLSAKDLMKGVVALGAMVGVVAGLAGILTMFDDQKRLVTGAIALIGMATAIRIMATSVAALGKLDDKELAKGLGGLFAMLGAIAAFIVTTGDSIGSQGIRVGLGILAISAALVVMAKAIRMLGSLGMKKLAKGLGAVAATMAILVVGLNELKYDSSGAASLLIAAAALTVLAATVKIYSSMPLKKVAKGLYALAASMAILVMGLKLMEGTTAGAAALLIAAVGLTALVPAITALGATPLLNLVKGLYALAATMVIMGAAGYALGGAVPGMIGLGIALALIGTSVFLVGAGISALAAAVVVLAGAGVAGATVFVGSMQIILVGLLTMIPNVAKALVSALVAFMQEMIARAGEIVTALTQLGVIVLDALRTLIPELVNFGLEMIVAILTGLANNMEEIVTQAGLIIAAFINGLANSQGEIIDAGMNLVISLIDGLADGIVKNAQRISEAMQHLAESLLEAFCIVLGIHSPSTVMEEQGVNIVMGLINGITSFIDSAVTTITSLGEQLLQGIGGFAGDFLDTGRKFVSNLAGGVSGAVTGAKTAVRGVVSSAASAARDYKDNFTKTGRNLAQGLIDGIKEMANKVAKAAAEVAKAAIKAANKALDERSPSKVFRQIGRYIDEGLILGLQDYTSKVEDESKSLASLTFGAFEDFSAGVGDPVIRPVVDLSDVNSKTSMIQSLMNNGARYAVGITGSISSNMVPAGAAASLGGGPIVNNTNFVQNNYSPTALSRLDIYRQTKNQFAMAKEALSR